MEVTLYTFPSNCFPRYENAKNRISNIMERTNKLLSKTFGTSYQDGKEMEQPECVKIYICENEGCEKFNLTGENLAKRHDPKSQESVKAENTESFLMKNRTNFNSSTIMIFREHSDLRGELKKFPPEPSFIILTGQQSRHTSYDLHNQLILASPEDDIATEICLLLERKAFEPMKEKFHLIRNLLSNPRDISTSSECSIASKCGTKSKFEEMKGKGGLTEKNTAKLLREIKTLTTANVVDMTKMYGHEKEMGKSGYCDIYTRLQNGVSCQTSYDKREDMVKATANTHSAKKGKWHFAENISEFQRILGEMIGMYRRSKIPDDLKPQYTGPLAEDKLSEIMKKLYLISSSVRGNSFRFITRLQIHVLGDDIEKLKPEIEKELLAHGIAPDFYDIVPPLDDVTPCNKIHVGSKVMIGKLYGSLGGFVKMTANENEESKYCLLASLHLLQGQTTVELSNEHRTLTANVITETAPCDAQMIFDIAAAEIKKDDIQHCDGRFKTEDGTMMKGEKYNKDISLLDGQHVHMNGATTPKGLGIIATTQYDMRTTETETVRESEGNVESREQDIYIYIENRTDSNTPFCGEGDSGAMVCADDEDGNCVQLISTVIGRNKSRSTQTLRLDSGISYLEEVTNSNIIFFEH